MTEMQLYRYKGEVRRQAAIVQIIDAVYRKVKSLLNMSRLSLLFCLFDEKINKPSILDFSKDYLKYWGKFLYSNEFKYFYALLTLHRDISV